MKILHNTKKSFRKNVKACKTFNLPVGFEGQEINYSLKPTHRNVIDIKSIKLVFIYLSLPHEVHRPSCLYSDVKEFKQHENALRLYKAGFRTVLRVSQKPLDTRSNK